MIQKDASRNGTDDPSAATRSDWAAKLRRRNNVHVSGHGSTTLIFVHGFGCDQNMWRLVEPAYRDRYRTVVLDLVGAGNSDLSAYDRKKYDSLHGYADDVVELAEEFGTGSNVFVGHSVSAMIGVLADLKATRLFAAHAMIGPSPCYMNDGDYIGGFERKDIESLLETLESNYLGWSGTMAPAIMGTPQQPELSEELTNSFCRTDPEIAKQFARVTFMSDHRSDLARLETPSLVLQCSDDLIAPITVGQYMQQALRNGKLKVIQNVGHCPHLSSPSASTAAIDEFLLEQKL